MTRNESMTTTTGQDERTSTGAVATGPRSRFGRPARIAAATAAVVAAGALVVGCGSKDPSRATPDAASGKAGPAGSSHSDASADSEAGDDADSKGGEGGKGGGSEDGGTGGSGGSDTSGSSTGSPTGGIKANSSTKGGAGTATDKSGGQYGSSKSGACTTSDLKATIGPNHPGAGQENFSLVFTNDSGKSCTVHGFPGLAFLNGGGDQVSFDPERQGASGKSVKLAPGKSAWAPLSFTNPGVTGVPTVTPDTVLLTPPDQRASLRVDWQGGPVTATGKASVPKIGSLVPGTGA